MYRWGTLGLLSLIGLGAQSMPDAELLIEQVRERARGNLAHMPDHVCLQTIERKVRSAPGAPWTRQDSLRLEVALVGNRELYTWQGASRFEERELADLVGRGTVGTGSFALHAKTVLLSGAAEITHAGRAGDAHRFNYSVPAESSRYRLRVHNAEAIVPFQGSFLADSYTLDLLKLEVHASDIPPKLGLTAASDVIEYARVAIGDRDYLLPRTAQLTLVGAYGDESVNQTEFGECRQYASESRLSFAEEPEVSRQAPDALPPNSVLEIELDRDILLDQSNIGDSIVARLAKPVGTIPAGAPVLGRIVRLEQSSLPFTHYVVSLRLEEVETPAGRTPVIATMEHVEPGGGLIRQARRLNPTFSRDRKPRMEILVREQKPGEGVLHWDARKPKLGRGLRMSWRTP